MPESRAAKVRLRRAQIRAQSEDWAEARKLAEPLVTAGGANLPEDELFYLLGRCQIAAANFEQARTSFRRAAQRDQRARTETAAMAQWMIGESLMHQENYQAAVAEYYRVVSLYPHPRWQAAALLQAAKCYEHLDRNQEAARLYRQIQEDYPETEFVEQAQERVERLPARSQAPQT
jgi:TolA-binding protein